jgi:hypothetical protein
MMNTLNDGFEPTRLDASQFPTADDLSDGTGAMIAERERRLRGKLARSDAYISPLQIEYVNQDFCRFCTSPSLSEGEFTAVRGERVAHDYIAQFERLLYSVHTLCAAVFANPAPASTSFGNAAKFKWHCDVLMFDISATWHGGSRVLVLSLVNVRPCAEMLGFFRIFLYELARNCVHYQALLQVSVPFPQTCDILRRAWGRPADHDVHEVVFEPRELVDAKERLGVAVFLLRSSNLKRRYERPSF